jgi:DNA-binding beta-propeller fold protein YncE
MNATEMVPGMRFARQCSGRATRPRKRAVPAVIGAFVVVLLGGSSVVSAQLCSWGGTPVLPPPDVEFLDSQPEGLRAPARLTTDSQDRIYLTDPTRGAVVVKDVYGGVVAVRGGMGVPLAIAVDAFDAIYVGDQSMGRVDIFDSSWQHAGVLGSGAGEFLSVTDIAVDPDLGLGLIFVADGGADLIKVYGPGGQLVRSFGGPGTGPGQFDFPSALWVSPGGEVFVGDQNNDRVQVFDRDGSFLRCFGAQGGGNRNFGRIQGVVGDLDGRVYVADAFQGHVKVFDGDGAELAVIGSLGDRPGQFRTPFGMAIDGLNRLFVSSVNSGRVEVFGLDDFLTPPPDGVIFSDGFESGDVNAWSDAAP